MFDTNIYFSDYIVSQFLLSKQLNKNENEELDAENSAAAASVYQSRRKYADGIDWRESDASSSMYAMRGENFLFEKLNGK